MEQQHTQKLYYNIEGYRQFPTILLDEIEVFEKLVVKYQPEFIWITQKKRQVESEKNDLIARITPNQKLVTAFCFVHDGIMYEANAMNFRTIEDYKTGVGKGFAMGDEYYTATAAGFIDKTEYDEATKAGFTERINYLNAKETGFLGAFDNLKLAVNQGRLNPTEYKKIKNLKNDAQIDTFADSLGYENYEEFEKALMSGFVKVTAQEYRTAVEKGFQTSNNYEKAKEGNFEDPTEFASAKQVGISKKGEFEVYQSLVNLKQTHNFRTIEQAHLFQLLSDLETGKKLSVSRIWDLLKDAQQELTGSNNTEDRKWFDTPLTQLFGKKEAFPVWYDATFQDIIELKVFLISNENLGKIGRYDADGEIFEKETVTLEVVTTEEEEAEVKPLLTDNENGEVDNS